MKLVKYINLRGSYELATNRLAGLLELSGSPIRSIFPAFVQQFCLRGHRLGLVVCHIDHRGAQTLGERDSSTRISTRRAASRFESGSSNRNTFGRRTIARPMATLSLPSRKLLWKPA